MDTFHLPSPRLSNKKDRNYSPTAPLYRFPEEPSARAVEGWSRQPPRWVGSGRPGPRGGENNISCQKADKTAPSPPRRCAVTKPRHDPPLPDPYTDFPVFQVLRQPWRPCLVAGGGAWGGEGGQRHYLGRGSDVTGGREGRRQGGGQGGGGGGGHHHHHRHPLLPGACVSPRPSTPLPPPYFAHLHTRCMAGTPGPPAAAPAPRCHCLQLPFSSILANMAEEEEERRGEREGSLLSFFARIPSALPDAGVGGAPHVRRGLMLSLLHPADRWALAQAKY